MNSYPISAKVSRLPANAAPIKSVKLFFLFGILLAMGTLTARAANPIDALVQDKRVALAMSWLDENLDWVTEQQIAITEIPAPEFHEAARAAYIAKLLAACGLEVHTDSVGNVIGERSGSSRKSNDVIIVVAHLDTVFPIDTDVHVKRVNGRLQAPGIADDGAGLAALVAIARAMNEAQIRAQTKIVFAADVGEEGEGNLRGIRELMDTYKGNVRAVIALDGAATDYVTTIGLASRRLDMQITGPGGHSWSDFGAPNPITALARGIVQFSRTRVPQEPRTTFNFGVIEGGNSVNSIPAEAGVKVDLRSEDDAELSRLESELRKAFASAVDEEMAAADPGNETLKLKVTVIGVRPGGRLAADSPLLAAIENVDRYLGNRSRLERSSTDANLPLSQGVPAIAIGAGGQGGGSHSLDEWYDPAGRELGLKRAMLTLLAIAGAQP
ncbi:MAG TPA: M20/M25/M40 family metallo-hydrolase [Candidatus Acidoferrales bacterium]|nr:M20/M25/M40 family metallo-hydrolase [Candidatus Acidoferrales bacterium]